MSARAAGGGVSIRALCALLEERVGAGAVGVSIRALCALLDERVGALLDERVGALLDERVGVLAGQGSPPGTRGSPRRTFPSAMPISPSAPRAPPPVAARS
ncbi:hypothetical protein ABA31_03680 [Agrococcus baldri]|uniref:Uncharacterized protein n=1 Tax=Agrococcus baldri TaxID=153730 RepID=A0AA87RIX0_9MICO|nr:hypothetical protein ABA31_03680 [Agrococcus baldri]